MPTEFSFRSRQESLRRFRDEVFDVLVIGGGITGAATARDAASRGLKVALVERRDFAFGTSSRSSKMIHGGLRYLQNMEFKLVFEALSERAYLTKTAPQLVRPVPFYLPFYEGDPNSMWILNLGLWLYDALALFRTPEFHRRLSRKKLMGAIPFLKHDGLKGGFRYFDACMWDDVLDVQVLRSAHAQGAALANYVEGLRPIHEGRIGGEPRVAGFIVRDQITGQGEIPVRAHRVVIAAGPWTDEAGARLSPAWHSWLQPSKGVHLIFDLKRIPVPGAMVMSHPEDGRISFVIPRPEMGAGIVIVGTTDGPAPAHAEDAEIGAEDVSYLMSLLTKYFPDLNLTTSDILGGYVGVRPLMKGSVDVTSVAIRTDLSGALQKVSREHHIDRGPGGTTVVAGGKYTTHRTMGTQIVDFVLKTWQEDVKKGGDGAAAGLPPVPAHHRHRTSGPIDPAGTPDALRAAQAAAKAKGLHVPQALWSRYGAAALDVVALAGQGTGAADPEGFPLIEAECRYSIRNELVMHLEDFYIRRTALYLSRRDHGMPWAARLAKVWAEERGVGQNEAAEELARLTAEIDRRTRWKQALSDRAPA